MSEEFTMRDQCHFDWQTADFQTLIDTAEKYSHYVWRTIHRPHSSGLNYLLILGYEPHSEYFESIPLGWYRTAGLAVDDAINLLETYKMNLHQNNKLFPYIRGVMLKDRAVELTLSKNIKVTELQGGDARVELAFTDHEKTAVINRNQAQNIINMYGPETDNWNGKKIILYGESGKWFGKFQWGIRVWDTTGQDLPPANVQKVLRKKNGRQDKQPETAGVVPFKKSVDEPEQERLLDVPANGYDEQD